MELRDATEFSRNILLVDDEQAVLDGIARRLGTDYDLTLADSPVAALELLGSSKRFAVVLTDMQMPGMDGLSFIRLARERSPQSVFLMLTGNQDLPTATRALNEGQVFRYFTKPCSSQDLRAGLDAALRQWQLLQAERELLQRTFVGSVNILCDIMGFAQPLLTIVNERMQRLIKFACDNLGWQTHWEYLVAAKLSLIGFVVSKPESFSGFLSVSELTEQDKRLYLDALETSARLLQKIPRLERIAALVGQMHKTDGSLTSGRPVNSGNPGNPGSSDGHGDIANGGAMLGVALAHVIGTRKFKTQLAGSLAAAQLYAAPDPQLVQIFQQHDKLNRLGYGAPHRVSTEQLSAGMVLAEDLDVRGAGMALRAGDVLTEVAVAHLPTIPGIPVSMSVQLPSMR